MPPSNGSIEQASSLGVIRRGIQTTPTLLSGLPVTGLIGLSYAIGRIATPIVIQQAIDRGGLARGDVQMPLVWQLVAIGVGVLLLTELLGIVAKRRLIRRAELSLRNLRTMAFDHVHRLSLAVHNEQATGVLISRVTADVDVLTRFADWGMFTWLVQPIVVLGIFVAMATYSWPLALLGFVLFMPVVPAMRWVRSGMETAHAERQEAIGDLLGAYSETLSGAAVVRTYGAQPRMRRRLLGLSSRRYRAGVRANLYMSGVFVIGDLLVAVMMATQLIVGIVWRDQLGLTAGGLVAILFLNTMLQSPVGELGETINQAQQAVAGWRNVLGVLERPVENLDPEDGVELPDEPLAVHATNLSFDYGDGVPVLRDVSVVITPGATIAIVGETGSGKSTFARLLCRLADPTSGHVQLGGVDLRSVAADARHESVRMVPQDGFLFDATVGENIAAGRSGATEAEIHAAIDLLGLRPWVEGLPDGLDTPVGERGSLLSVGERQLVSFVRASLANPGLLILDEATSSVDPQADRMLTAALARLAEGRTVVSIAHRLATAEAADVVLVFDDGEIVETGTHTDLLALDGVYTRLHRAWSEGRVST